MRLRSSRGYDTNDGAPHRVGDKKHAAIDQTDSVESQFVGSLKIVELDYVRLQEHLGGCPEVEAVLLPVGLLLFIVVYLKSGVHWKYPQNC